MADGPDRHGGPVRQHAVEQHGAPGPDPYAVREDWLATGKIYGADRTYGPESAENYRRDLGQLTPDGYSLDLIKLADWRLARDTAARAAVPFDRPPPPLGWIPFAGPLIWEATPLHVDTWLNQWKTGAARSRARRRAALYAFYEHARTWRIVPGNPVTAIRPPATSDLPRRITLTLREAGMLRSAADLWATPRDRLLLYLLLARLRPGQVCGLHIDRTYPEQHRTVSRVPVKGGWFDRTPWEWPPEAVEALNSYRPHRAHRQPHSGPGTGPLLTSRYGKPLTADTEPRRVVRSVAELHPGLAHLAPRLTADGVSLSPSPFADDDLEQPARPGGRGAASSGEPGRAPVGPPGDQRRRTLPSSPRTKAATIPATSDAPASEAGATIGMTDA
ncbi:hypothetical protein [Streptomyces yaizuensis]|uniref:Core-binding (CB) domain-containing protein n=1 Tax=Streptomyces yaizuensis TaxID=2989713 RepID=A0AA86JGA4_9ACTN|nr:hypothetical protein [Streptomyces sp. YSPA8]BDT39469.1 hypothetical protein SYYSPA8_36755 [Streptomyces sp. YSPA8]